MPGCGGYCQALLQHGVLLLQKRRGSASSQMPHSLARNNVFAGALCMAGAPLCLTCNGGAQLCKVCRAATSALGSQCGLFDSH